MATHTYTTEQFIEQCLWWRGIEPGCECNTCGGAGTRAYGSTSTWRGGVGGQMITSGVCDKCWGSGDKDRPWPSHRRIAYLESEMARLKALQPETK